MAFEVVKAQIHIRQLCKKNKIKYIVRAGRGQAKVVKRIIYLPVILTIKNYWIALHEIGHVMIGMDATVLERERMAWEWALDNAKIKPSQDIRQAICSLLVRHMYEAPDETPSEAYKKLMEWWH